VTLRDFDYVCFHSPYNKLVRKGFGRLCYNEFKQNILADNFPTQLQEYKSLTPEDSLKSDSLCKAFTKFSQQDYHVQVEPSTLLSRNCGNMYTASLPCSLVSLVYNISDSLAGKRVLMFSYGSGLASTMFSFRIESTVAARAELRNISKTLDLAARLANRKCCSPEQYDYTMQIRENLMQRDQGDVIEFEPHGDMTEGTYYLTRVDEIGRRLYNVIQ